MVEAPASVYIVHHAIDVVDQQTAGCRKTRVDFGELRVQFIEGHRGRMAQEHDATLLTPQHGLTGGMEQMTASCSTCTLNHEGVDVCGMCDDVIGPHRSLTVALEHGPLTEGMLVRPAQAPRPRVGERGGWPSRARFVPEHGLPQRMTARALTERFRSAGVTRYRIRVKGRHVPLNAPGQAAGQFTFEAVFLRRRRWTNVLGWAPCRDGARAAHLWSIDPRREAFDEAGRRWACRRLRLGSAHAAACAEGCCPER